MTKTGVGPATSANAQNFSSEDFDRRTVERRGLYKGKGAKYLILPLGYKEKAPTGYISLPSTSNAGYPLLRLIHQSDRDINFSPRMSATALLRNSEENSNHCPAFRVERRSLT
jgi:hypothetical protein